jgi:SAM-dependent methyltransferase
MGEKVCPFCGGLSLHLFCRKADSQYVQCASCGIVFAQPRLTQVEVKHEAEYWARRHHASSDKVSLDFSKQHFQVVHRPRLNALAGYRKLGRLLDVGCATGSFLKAATEDGWDAFGVEIAEFSARYGIEEQGLNIFVGTLEEAKFPNSYFDAEARWGAGSLHAKYTRTVPSDSWP